MGCNNCYVPSTTNFSNVYIREVIKEEIIAASDTLKGDSAYEVAVKLGYRGNENEWLTEQGATIEQINVTTGAAGTNASVALNGTPKNRRIDLTIPRGDKGIQGEKGEVGLSNYEVALSSGFVGSKAEWLSSIKGEKGDRGIDGIQGEKGKSTYDLSVDYGFVGSEREWLSGIVNDTELMSNLNEDLLSIDKAANGDIDTTVVTRTGETYPSAKKAISDGIISLFENGGLPATPFATKVLMEASDLVDGQYAMVTDDTVNNGLYIKTAGAWVKSTYDSLGKALEVIDTFSGNDDAKDLLRFVDVEGSIFSRYDNHGGLHLAGLDLTVQDSLSKNVNNVYMGNSANLYDFQDEVGNTVAVITQDGTLSITDIAVNGGSVDRRLKILEGNPNSGVIDLTSELRKASDYTIASRDKDPMLQASDLFTHTELGVVYAFAPSLCRISKNEYLTFCEARTGGDYGVTKLMQRKLTINDDYSTTLGAVKTVADNGVEGGKEFSCLNSCSIKVESGAHAGRVYLYYLKLFTSPHRDVACYKYSDDNGDTWSAEQYLAPFIPDMENKTIVTVGAGGKAIQLKNGSHAGRMILPCYYADLSYPSSLTGMYSFILYSDDGGVTYTMGAVSTIAGSNECQVAELDDGDIMMLIRNESPNKYVQVSSDGGVTFDAPRVLGDVQTVKVESGFCQFRNDYDLSVPKLIISTPTKVGRKDLGLYGSYNNGESFELMKVVTNGVASYSDILPIDESHILVAYSEGTSTEIDKKVVTIVINLKSILLGE